MSNWERRPLRKSQQHYGSLDAWILIEILKKVAEKAKSDGLPPLEKFTKTLDNRNIIITADIDSDDFDEETKQQRLDEKIVVGKNNKSRGKRQHFNKNKNYNQNKGNNNGPKEDNGISHLDTELKKGESFDSSNAKTYGNSYGKKGSSNNISLLHNEELRASMWQSHGFIVDRNLNKLAKMLQEKGIDCLIPDTQESSQICSKALE